MPDSGDGCTVSTPRGEQVVAACEAQRALHKDLFAVHNAIVAAQDIVPGRVAQVASQVVGQFHRLRAVSGEVSVEDVEYLHVTRVHEPAPIFDVIFG